MPGGFDPLVHGFGFPNRYHNLVLARPRVVTAGRCGGMAFASLDYYLSSRPVPRFECEEFPPRNAHPLSRYLFRRQLDSFARPAALRFVWETLRPTPFPPLGPSFQRLRLSLRGGAPLVLGLVRARSWKALGSNHQLVAYATEGLDPELEDCVIRAYDPNFPGRVSELLLGPGREGLKHAESGTVWRSFFVQSYRVKTPPAPASLERAAEDLAGLRGVPLRPHRPLLVARGNQTVLTWRAGGDRAAGYLIERAEPRLRAGGEFTVVARVRSPEVETLLVRAVASSSPGTAYRLRAVNEEGMGPPSEPVYLRARSHISGTTAQK